MEKLINEGYSQEGLGNKNGMCNLHVTIEGEITSYGTSEFYIESDTYGDALPVYLKNYDNTVYGFTKTNMFSLEAGHTEIIDVL